MKYWFIIVLLLWISRAQAQVGTCEPALAEAFLEVGNVRARIFNNGGLFWRGSPHAYEVPKGGGASAIFSANIWVGGMIGEDIRTAATRYGPWEFWAGPLDDNGNPPASCKQFDKIWEITRSDLETFVRSGDVSSNLKNWPWHLGAPVIDGDGNPNNYNLQGGDMPALLGDQRLWWIMNDRGNVHEASDTAPIGLEVHASAHAFAHPGFIGNNTFYEYKLINKNSLPFKHAFFGFFKDSDLGNFDDDYVGSDSLLHLGFTYNADNDDEGGEGYGTAPPAVGITFLETIPADADNYDNNRDGQIDEPGEKIGAYGMMKVTGGGAPNGEPILGPDYYNYMQSRWKDGTALLAGLRGYFRNLTQDGALLNREVTRFAFSGDPVTKAFWSEFDSDGEGTPLYPGDRRNALSTGPFTIGRGDTVVVRFAIVWARGSDNLDSVSQLRKDVSSIHDFADSFYAPVMVESETVHTQQDFVLGLDQNFPNPFTQTTTLRYSLPQTMQVRLAVYDILGRQVALLVDAQQEAGIHTADFDAGDLPAGVYLARIELDFLRFTKRMILLR
ncbi:MAG: T9SS type A sorting domain-containing protein [Bacteroidota bacterium]